MSCPQCGCPNRTKKGRTASGNQRWLCKGCGHRYVLQRQHGGGRKRIYKNSAEKMRAYRAKKKQQG